MKQITFTSHVVLPLVLAGVLIVTGCAIFKGDARKAADRAQDKTDQAKEQVEQQKEVAVKHGVANTAAADKALSLDPQPNVYTQVAEGRLDSAQQAFSLGGVSPDAKDVAILKEAVTGMVSTNEADRVSAQKALARIDAKLEIVQKQLQISNAKLDAASDRERDLMDKLASEANLARSLKKWLWWGGIGFVLYLVLTATGGLMQFAGVFNPVIGVAGTAIKAAPKVFGSIARDLHEGVEKGIDAIKNLDVFDDDDDEAVQAMIKKVKADPEDALVSRKQVLAEFAKAQAGAHDRVTRDAVAVWQQASADSGTGALKPKVTKLKA